VSQTRSGKFGEPGAAAETATAADIPGLEPSRRILRLRVWADVAPSFHLSAAVVFISAELLKRANSSAWKTSSIINKKKGKRRETVVNYLLGHAVLYLGR